MVIFYMHVQHIQTETFRGLQEFENKNSVTDFYA